MENPRRHAGAFRGNRYARASGIDISRAIAPRQPPSLAELATPIIAVRVEHLAKHLHGLGLRATHEYIVEMAVRFGPEVIERLEAYGRLDREVVRAVGGDRFLVRLAVLRGDRRRRSVANKLLRAAVTELDSIMGEGLDPDLADRLTAVGGLVEEALGEVEAVPS